MTKTLQILNCSDILELQANKERAHMVVFNSCEQAIRDCLQRQTFSVAHLYSEEKTMDMHIHDCYEIYYSISGGKQFLIDNNVYSVAPGDLFIINQFESHKLSDVDSSTHERIILNIYPSYVKALSTDETDLDECFSKHPAGFQHKISLSKENQRRFLYLLDKLVSVDGYGCDIIQRATFLELMVMLNHLSTCNTADDVLMRYKLDHQVDEILAYINQNLSAQITIQSLSEQFYVSPSYLCRIFKKATGTTVGKYINARRITIARALLSEGSSVKHAYERSGFTDYSTFFKTFTKVVGISPKKYAILCHTV